MTDFINQSGDQVQADKAVFTVSQLNRRARQLLETHLSLIWVEGEVSNLARPSSGHWYFTLKDDEAQIRCAMFRNRNQRVQHPVEAGDQVLVRGRVSLYENRGDYQLIVEHLEPAGLGVLQRRFELLKARLAEEGLFDQSRKLALPRFPRHLGVITSPTGAAIRDVLNVLKRRFPALPVTIYPTPVQGEGAVGGIQRALALANSRDECDVLLLVRGGGSLEDLWAFNEEAVARAVAASVIPVVAGVGHETDTTIVDFVADLRASTPSAAAELISPDASELNAVLQSYRDWFSRQARTQVTAAAQALNYLRRRLRHPHEIVEKQGQHLDHLEVRLFRAMQLHLHSKHLELDRLHHRLNGQAPAAKLAQLQQRFGYLSTQLSMALKHLLERKREELAGSAKLLQAVSPLNTLERGYAIAQTASGRVITHTADAEVGQEIVVTLTDGSLDCEVLAQHPRSISQTDLSDD